MQEIDYIKLGMRIRQIRKSRGWSQGELAKKAGISMSFMGHIERGSRIMSLETFAGICAALNAGADELLWGMANPSGSVLNMWDLSENKKNDKESDSYSMYIKIMKSVAEIMNEV